jgi:hypothetical protein
MRSSDRVTRAERRVQHKIVSRQKLTDRDKRVIQQRVLKNIQRAGFRGADIPGGAQIVPVAGVTDMNSNAVVGLMNSMASSMANKGGMSAPNFNGTPAGSAVRNIMGANLPQRSYDFYHVETTGINQIWSGTVTWAIENKKDLDETQADMAATGGGSAGHSTGQSSTTTTGGSAEAGGSVGGHEGAAGGSAKGGVSGSTATTSSSGTTVTGKSETGATTKDKVKREQADLYANVFMKTEADADWTSYINPLMWGVHLGDAISPTAPKEDSVRCGTIVFQSSGGFAK